MKTYSVSLCVATWETGNIQAESFEEALKLAREEYEEGLWDGTVHSTERQPEDDSVYCTAAPAGDVEGLGETWYPPFDCQRRCKERLKHFDSERMVAVTWGVEDVQETARTMGRAVPTDEQAMEILENIVCKHDAEMGITWAVLEDWVANTLPVLNVCLLCSEEFGDTADPAEELCNGCFSEEAARG